MEKEYQQTELELEETNMYILFARMFACIAREVGEKFGDEGIRAVREGVRQFGEARGRNIAERARAMGGSGGRRHHRPHQSRQRQRHWRPDRRHQDGGALGG